MKVYLSGPIAGLTYDEANKWRLEATDKFAQHGIQTINPLRGRFFIHASDEVFEPNEIVGRDLKDVSDCDLMLVYLPKGGRFSIGTTCEIWHAYAVEHRPTVVVSDNSDFVGHPWMKVAVTKFFDNLDKAIAYIASRWNDAPDDNFLPERF